MRYTVMLLAALVLGPGCRDEDGNPAPAADALTDIHGEPVPATDDRQGVTVMIFITTDCPIANAYAPEIRRIVDDYGKRDVSFTLVHVDPDTTAAIAIKHQKDYQLPSPIVLDARHALVGKAGITVTPEACVRRGADGEILYRGRIDNLFPALGSRRQQASRHELRDALDAVLDGKTVAVSRSEAVGCSLPTPR